MSKKVELMLPNPLIIGRQYHFALKKSMAKVQDITKVLNTIKKSHETLIRELIEDLEILEKDKWDFEVEPFGFIKASKSDLKFSVQDRYKDELAKYLLAKGVKNVYDAWGPYDIVSDKDRTDTLSIEEEAALYKALNAEEKRFTKKPE